MKHIKLSKVEILNVIEWISVLFVSAYMTVYGVSKYVQFGSIEAYRLPVKDLEPMQLMWAFYSYSKPYVLIIGVFEVLGALLFVLPKTRIIGGFLLTSILVNIILQDYFYEVLQGALAYAILFQILISFVLFKHRERIKNAFSALKGQFRFKIRPIYVLVAILVVLSFEALLILITQLLTLLQS